MNPILDEDFNAPHPRWQRQEDRILRGYGLRPYDVKPPANGNRHPQQAAA